MPVTSQCEMCGKSIEGRRRRGRRDVFCGRECFEKFQLERVKKKCERCKKPFEVGRRQSGRRFCGAVCQRLALIEPKPMRERVRASVEARPRACAACGYTKNLEAVSLLGKATKNGAKPEELVLLCPNHKAELERGQVSLDAIVQGASPHIDGVRVKRITPYLDERGRLWEIYRNDDAIFKGFGQTYLTSCMPGVVKGWHYHKKQTDNFFCVGGAIKLVLYDDRVGSPTFGKVDEFFMSPGANNILVQIPPYVFHGFKGVSSEEAFVLNVPDRPYFHDDPDEFRLDPHDNYIPYDWDRFDG